MNTVVNPLVVSEFDRSSKYLASVIVALDTHQIRVTSIDSNDLNTAFNLPSDNTVSVLRWIPFQEEDQILALGLTNGSIVLYSPFTNTIITRLSTASGASITDFKHSSITNSFWASDIDGVIYEWDSNYNFGQQFSINTSLETSESINSITVINYESEPHILAGSQSIYLVNINTKQVIKTFPAHIQPIKSILPVPLENDLFVSCANGDRFINLYSISKQSTKSVFVTDTPVVDVEVGVDGDKSVLIARTEAGNIEVFNSFLSEDVSVTSQTNSRKKKRQQLANTRSRHCDGNVSLQRHEDDIKPSTSPEIAIVSCTINQDSIIYCWLENSNVPVFDSLRWLATTGIHNIIEPITLKKKKADLSVPHHAMNGHDVASAKQYNEGNAIVSDGYNLNNVVEDDDEEEGETLAEKVAKLATDAKPAPAKQTKKPTTTNTLTTVLSQSLRNNDHSLLETVLMTKDHQVIQNTIAKLDSSLAIVLLDRLSERIARQANRFDQLVYWLKWVIVIHGGILASLPGLSSKLSNLHGILSRKSDTLPRLLQLQNKIQIINEYTEVNRNLQPEELESDEDTDIEYVEELDDANLLNGDGMDLHDDYEDSDDDVDMESEDEPEKLGENDLEVDVQDEEGYSDEEIGVNNNDVESDEE